MQFGMCSSPTMAKSSSVSATIVTPSSGCVLMMDMWAACWTITNNTISSHRGTDSGIIARTPRQDSASVHFRTKRSHIVPSFTLTRTSSTCSSQDALTRRSSRCHQPLLSKKDVTTSFARESLNHALSMPFPSPDNLWQWDINSGKLVQEYDAHLGGVNSITFADNNRRFITTSDDKKIYIWEWGIPVVMKHISEPHMHSVPCVVKHPSGGSSHVHAKRLCSQGTCSGRWNFVSRCSVCCWCR